MVRVLRQNSPTASMGLSMITRDVSLESSEILESLVFTIIFRIPSMWHIYRSTWIVDLYGKLVDKYASPMDIPWNSLNLKGFILQKRLQDTSTDVAEATAGMTLVGGLTSGFGTGIGWLKWLNVWTMQVDHYQSNMTSFENWNLDIVKVFQGVCIP